jgi:hypothetical protein
LFFGKHKNKNIDKTLKVRGLEIPLVDVPASQALLNLFYTVFGNPGVPSEFFISASKIAGLRLVARRSINRQEFNTILLNKRYLSYGVRLRQHVSPACNDFAAVTGVALLSNAYSWGNPIVVIAQMPTKALWRSYDPVDKLLGGKVGYKPSGRPSQLLPGKTLVDAVFKSVASAEYPVLSAWCSEPARRVENCPREALVIIMDEYVSTLMYAVNTSVFLPEARGFHASTVETLEAELKPPTGEGGQK